jgi:predicted NBD/HSP70 family sugar kinase
MARPSCHLTRLARGSLRSSLPLLRLLDRGGRLSQAEAATGLGLTAGACSLHLQRLEHEGLVRRADRISNGKGRPAIVWDLDRKANACMVFVFDVPFFQATLLDFAAQPLLEQRLDLSRARAPADVAAAILGFADAALALAARSRTRVRQVVGGFPGLFDPADGTVRHAVNFPALDGLNLARLFAPRRLPAWSGSLSLCFFFGETADLPADATTLVVHWDLGVGAIAGRGETVLSVQFDRGGAPEIPEVGHMCVAPGGRPCRCGRRGCLEAYTGGQAMLADLAARDVRTLGDFIAALEAGRADALAVARRAARTLGRHIAWPVQLMGAGRVRVTGPLSVAFAPLAAAFRRGLEETLPAAQVAALDVAASPDPRGRLRAGAGRLATRLFFDPDSAARLPRSPARLD